MSASTPLYYHKTDGGAEYLTDRFALCPDGSKEGVFDGASIIVRIDGDIRKDAELVRFRPEYAAARAPLCYPYVMQ